MIRSLMGLLIIVVIFLAGMVVGVGKEDHHSIGDSAKLTDFNPDLQMEKEETVQTTAENDSAGSVDNLVEQDTPKHFTQKMATSLESVVKGFYDIIVQLCYAFANLFF